MKELRYTSQAKKDLKRYRNNPDKMEKLFVVLQMLANDVPLPPKYKAHALLGQYKDCMECHVEGDFLLIWMDRERNLIEVVRIGSHSELF